MGSFERFGKVLLIVQCAVVIYLIFTAIQALDRLHLSNMKVLAALEKLESSRAASPAPEKQAIVPQRAANAVPAANAEYFDPAAKFGGKQKVG